jgi:DNA mismatch endonuclease, patch repair protein
MQAIRSTSKLENRVTSSLWKRGYRFRKNSKDLFGKPDISIKKYQLAIFIDSCFWHHCSIHGNMPKNNKEFWEKKLRRNIERDKEVSKFYQEHGWNLLRVWEHELKNDFDLTINKITTFIEDSKRNASEKK